MSKREYVQMPGTQELFEQWGLVEAVRAENTVSVSGQVGWNEKGEVIEGLEAQSLQAFQNLKTILGKAGAEPRHITHLTFYFVNPGDGSSMEERAGIVVDAKSKVMPECKAAATGVGVTELVMPGLLIEIQATALID